MGTIIDRHIVVSSFSSLLLSFNLILLLLTAGDSWIVPKGAKHTYKIVEEFTAVEATHPPAEVKNRDAPSKN